MASYKAKPMHLKIFILSILFFCTLNCFSQQKLPVDVSDITTLTFLSPGIAFEKRIGVLQTIRFHAYMNTSVFFSYSDTFGSDAGINFDPGATLQYRYYYNALKRLAKGKNITHNSLNYLSPIAAIVFANSAVSIPRNREYQMRTLTTLGLVWGMQRNYAKHFSLDLNLGMGYRFVSAMHPVNQGQPEYAAESKPIVIAQLNLGFWLNRKIR